MIVTLEDREHDRDQRTPLLFALMDSVWLVQHARAEQLHQGLANLAAQEVASAHGSNEQRATNDVRGVALRDRLAHAVGVRAVLEERQREADGLEAEARQRQPHEPVLHALAHAAVVASWHLLECLTTNQDADGWMVGPQQIVRVVLRSGGR
mgnify:CR=1 FL=1